MKVAQKNEIRTSTRNTRLTHHNDSLTIAIRDSWAKVAPLFPLKNFIAVNPIAGFETLPFEEALKHAQVYFQQKNIPEGMQHVNRESIKWLQVFFDEGQSTIQMPNRDLGFLSSILSLIKFDKLLHKNDPEKLQWLKTLPGEPESLIEAALLKLGIQEHEKERFLTLMLTTLPGWAAHIQYHTSWAHTDFPGHYVTQSEYLAFRLVLICLLWTEAKELIQWHQDALENANVEVLFHEISSSEVAYQSDLLKKIQQKREPENLNRPKAQLVFCIDVRSEPFRRALERQGNYETYGFAGFFGVPVIVKNTVTGETHAGCPVLLQPTQTVTEYPSYSQQCAEKRHGRIEGFKKIYQSLKYTFTTPFNLVEVIGIGSGLWMGLRSLFPNIATKIKSGLRKILETDYKLRPDIQSMPLDDQLAYCAGVLNIMGLTDNFSPLVIFCSHGSTTQNNAYATLLDCGACGGHHGASNARILAAILNTPDVRNALLKKNIVIPSDTLFVAAEHNTTTDEVVIYESNLTCEKTKEIAELKASLEKASEENSLFRASEMGFHIEKNQVCKAMALRSQDWAQVRPEWGLARNAAFIVAPRSLTKHVDLEGRTFLHSYDWKKDDLGSSLATILTAPMVVAQWINAQYLFSTTDNVAFGSGSKITQNITGKIGVMQGNASDLMHGLPLQSVCKSDEEAYHKPLRLTVIIYAPKTRLQRIIKQHFILQRLLGNGWVHLICYDPVENERFTLTRDLMLAR